MHFAGGVWLAGAGLWWRFYSGKFSDKPLDVRHITLWGAGIACGVGLGWELYEATVSYIAVGHINPLPDTIGDLFFDALGGIIVSIAVRVRISRKLKVESL